MTGRKKKTGEFLREQQGKELAWSWLRFQPDSGLSQWFWERFGHGNKRNRKVGIVALARKLLIALWHWVEHDRLPEGAVLMQ